MFAHIGKLLYLCSRKRKRYYEKLFLAEEPTPGDIELSIV